MWDKDLIAFAREKGYFTGADKDFSFQAAYNPFDFSGLYVCEARVWSFFNHFSNDMDQYFDYATGKTFRESKGQNEGEHMPLWIIPNRKVSAQDLKECMRDEYKGTPLDITQGTDAGPWNSKLRFGGLGFKCAVNGTDTLQYWYERPTATQQTAWSFVAQMRQEQIRYLLVRRGRCRLQLLHPDVQLPQACAGVFCRRQRRQLYLLADQRLVDL